MSNDGVRYRKNSTFVKPFNTRTHDHDVSPNLVSPSIEVNGRNTPVMQPHVDGSPVRVMADTREDVNDEHDPPQEVDTYSRPRRTHKLPAKFDDYVMNSK